jgi:hypothetical protein
MSATKDQIKAGFHEELNSHGFGFQYSVIKLAGELCSNDKNSWIVEASEFPVQV